MKLYGTFTVDTVNYVLIDKVVKFAAFHCKTQEFTVVSQIHKSRNGLK